MIDAARQKKISAIIVLVLSIGIGVYFANKAILEIKDINSHILKIENLQMFEIFTADTINPQEMPLKVGSLKRDKSAYFSLQFEFYGTNANIKPENLFQTGPFNSGVRVEQYGKSLSVIYPEVIGSRVYSIIELTNNLQSDQIHSLKIQALSKEFLRINFNGNITTITSPTLVFSTQDFQIGGGFDGQRNYSGILLNVDLKKVNYHSPLASVLRKYPKDFNEILSFIAQGGIFLAALIFLSVRKLKVKM